MTLTGTFRITEIDGAPAASGFELTLDAEGRVHGRALNRFSGTAEQSEGTLEFGAIAATRMAGSPEVMAQEDALFRVLSGAVTVTVEDDDVRLVGAGGALRLAPLSEGEPDGATLV